MPICNNCNEPSSEEDWDDLTNCDVYPIFCCPKCHMLYSRYEYEALKKEEPDVVGS